jgi:hypothetical protein
MRILVAVLTAISMTGCISGACTAIGCVDQVTYQLDSAAASQFAVGQAVQVKACVGTSCVTETLTLTMGNDVAASQSLTYLSTSRTLEYRPGPIGVEPQRVTLELSRGGNLVASLTKDPVNFSRFQPNGPGCEPVCRQASVSF